ncbi:MAG: UDP-N-acetylmuramate--L-alanine ligase [Synergistaceae bacterium]|nr:UDP-N-acetylmuramate--L-alanine ligase [Synergistaceae bacterium]
MDKRDINLRNKSIHLMGIGGAGMSGLAILLDQIGAKVSGCDAVRTSYMEHLNERNIPIIIGHEAKHVDDFMPNILVYSSAIPNDHPEILKAWQQGIAVSRRAEVLSQIFNVRRGVGVAGTHGKTTTSSMISLIAEMAGIDPTIAIGGELEPINTNAKLGESDYMVAELDESDRSFVYFHPEIAVVTNIDWDHRDHYMTFKAVTDAFSEFFSHSKKEGKIIMCMEDEGIRKLRAEYEISGDIVSYGWGRSWNWGASELCHFQGGGLSYRLCHNGEDMGQIELGVSGEHNVLNSLAAYAAAYEMGISHEDIVKGLKAFSGAKRRLQKTGEVGDILVYDDYGHHPNEIVATLSTVRLMFPERRLVAIFQPHRFSRTAALYKEFAGALSLADRAFILPIYGSDERPMEGVSSQLIFDAASDDMRSHYELSGNFDDLISSVCQAAASGDIILTLGAGSVGTLGKKIVERLGELAAK